MEGGERKKKRKMEVAEAEEEEEKKIEKFFALIKSTREVCEMLKGSPNWPLGNEKRDEQGMMKTSTSSTWNPSFQVEDFLDQDDNKAIGADHSAGPSSMIIQQEKVVVEEEQKVEDEEGNGLDLKLSL